MTRRSTCFIQAAKPGTTTAETRRKRIPAPTKTGGGKGTCSSIPCWTQRRAATPQRRISVGARRFAGALIGRLRSDVGCEECTPSPRLHPARTFSHPLVVPLLVAPAGRGRPALYRMHRRELLQIVGAVALTPLLAPLSAEERVEVARTIHQKRKNGPLRVLTPAQAALVTAVAERIIPRTDTPGATDADVTGFVDMLLADWYKDEDRARFLRGLAAMDAEAMALEKGSPGTGEKVFAACRPETQDALLSRWDSSESGPETATANFKRLKGLTVYGYFTSEIAVREVTKPVIFHPAFEGCVPFPAVAK